MWNSPSFLLLSVTAVKRRRCRGIWEITRRVAAGVRQRATHSRSPLLPDTSLPPPLPPRTPARGREASGHAGDPLIALALRAVWDLVYTNTGMIKDVLTSPPANPGHLPSEWLEHSADPDAHPAHAHTHTERGVQKRTLLLI